MRFPLFSEVQLTQDIPQFNLKKGSIGVIVEHYHPTGYYFELVQQKECHRFYAAFCSLTYNTG